MREITCAYIQVVFKIFTYAKKECKIIDTLQTIKKRILGTLFFLNTPSSLYNVFHKKNIVVYYPSLVFFVLMYYNLNFNFAYRYLRKKIVIVYFCFRYLTIGCSTLKFILRHFGDTIRNNVQSPVGSFGVDISREERYQKSLRCHEFLGQIRSFVVKKQTLPGIGTSFKEIHTMMQNFLD